MVADAPKIAETQIPILIGEGYDHIMCHAYILEQGETVTLRLSAKGQEASTLLAILSSGEPQALQFVAIPVQPRTTRKEN